MHVNDYGVALYDAGVCHLVAFDMVPLAMLPSRDPQPPVHPTADAGLHKGGVVPMASIC
jgi:hypothetical protein